MTRLEAFQIVNPEINIFQIAATSIILINGLCEYWQLAKFLVAQLFFEIEEFSNGVTNAVFKEYLYY